MIGHKKNARFQFLANQLQGSAKLRQHYYKHSRLEWPNWNRSLPPLEGILLRPPHMRVVGRCHSHAVAQFRKGKSGDLSVSEVLSLTSA
jgi:hypothetical protein